MMSLKTDFLVLAIITGLLLPCQLLTMVADPRSLQDAQQKLEQILEKPKLSSRNVYVVVNLLQWARQEQYSQLLGVYEEKYLKHVYKMMEGTDEETRPVC